MRGTPDGQRKTYSEWFNPRGHHACANLGIVLNRSHKSEGGLDDEIAPELTGHGLPHNKCEAYNRVHNRPHESR
jgi:hypothetical protein